MRKLVAILLLLVGCTSTTYKIGDCVFVVSINEGTVKAAKIELKLENGYLVNYGSENRAYIREGNKLYFELAPHLYCEDK